MRVLRRQKEVVLAAVWQQAGPIWASSGSGGPASGRLLVDEGDELASASQGVMAAIGGMSDDDDVEVLAFRSDDWRACLDRYRGAG